MKKRLDKSDIDKLTDEEKEILSKVPGMWKSGGVPMMTIGDMLEFLSKRWSIRLSPYKSKKDQEIMIITGGEPEDLCNCLWMMVKEAAIEKE